MNFTFSFSKKIFRLIYKVFRDIKLKLDFYIVSKYNVYLGVREVIRISN